MKNFARFHFALENGDPLIISYVLHDTSLKDRWIEMVNNRNINPNPRFNLTISNKTISDLPIMMEKLNSIISKINEKYDRTLPVFTSLGDVTRNRLNFLHEEFENYGARFEEYKEKNTFCTTYNSWYTKDFDLDFHESWLKLNENIHMTESAMGCDINDPYFMCCTQFYPFEQGRAIQPEDKLFLTTDIQWGDLVLGYNTLGKDYMDACWGDDVRVITNNQIKVQEYFSTEVYLNFEFNRYKKTMEEHFWKWYQSFDEETRKLVPIGDFNALSLGRYHIGSVMFDNAFLDFHPCLEDWENGNLDLRKKWNIAVFSKIEKITKIEIVDLDTYRQICSIY